MGCLIQRFINTNYNINVTVGRSDADLVVVAYPNNFNAAYINIVCGANVATINWQVCGYIS